MTINWPIIDQAPVANHRRLAQKARRRRQRPASCENVSHPSKRREGAVRMATNKELAIGKGGEGSWEEREEEVAKIGRQHGEEKVRIGDNTMEGVFRVD